MMIANVQKVGEGSQALSLDYENFQKMLKQNETKRKFEERQNEIKRRIPARYQNVTFENFEVSSESQKKVLNTVIKYTQTFAERLRSSTSLIFCGNPGTGKTHLSWSLFRNLSLSGYSCTHINFEKLLEKMTESKREKFEQRLDRWVKPDLLIIDEIDWDEKEASWKKAERRHWLFEIVNERYVSANKSVLLVTNLNLDQFSEFFGKKTLDRLLQCGCVLSFHWQSFRTQGDLNF
jgi:DNA replication protein DnaC